MNKTSTKSDTKMYVSFREHPRNRHQVKKQYQFVAILYEQWKLDGFCNDWIPIYSQCTFVDIDQIRRIQVLFRMVQGNTKCPAPSTMCPICEVLWDKYESQQTSSCIDGSPDQHDWRKLWNITIFVLVIFLVISQFFHHWAASSLTR